MLRRRLQRRFVDAQIGNGVAFEAVRAEAVAGGGEQDCGDRLAYEVAMMRVGCSRMWASLMCVCVCVCMWIDR